MFDDLDLPVPTTADNIPESGQGEKPEASALAEALSDSLEDRIHRLKQAKKSRCKHSKVYSIIVILFFSILLGGAVYAGYYFWDEISVYFPAEEYGDIFICSLETKECPDGTLVSRVPPGCEFKECLPAVASECAEEGEFIIASDLSDNNIACCEDLSAWAAFSVIDGDCQKLSGEDVCINCPNSECGEGENKCNCPEDCSPTSETATTAPVNRCELVPDAGPCRAKFTGYFYNGEEENCQEFIWGGCEGLVPFNSLEECRDECENVSTSTKNIDLGRATSSDKVIAALDTSDWQTYRNEEYGFEIKYPKSWKLCNFVDKNIIQFMRSDLDCEMPIDGPKTVNGERSPYSIYMFKIKENKNIYEVYPCEDCTNYNELIEKLNNRSYEDDDTGLLVSIPEELTIGGNKSICLDISWPFGNATTEFNIFYKDRSINISVNVVNDRENCLEGVEMKEINQILSIFKFIDSDMSTSTNELTTEQDVMISNCSECDDDQDGLINSDEDKYGTDINNPDTDGDGYLDGDEVKNGYNPNGDGKL